MLRTPPCGMVMVSRQIGHLNVALSRDCASTILSRQLRHTVCEHGNSLGVCSCKIQHAEILVDCQLFYFVHFIYISILAT